MKDGYVRFVCVGGSIVCCCCQPLTLWRIVKHTGAGGRADWRRLRACEAFWRRIVGRSRRRGERLHDVDDMHVILHEWRWFFEEQHALDVTHCCSTQVYIESLLHCTVNAGSRACSTPPTLCALCNWTLDLSLQNKHHSLTTSSPLRLNTISDYRRIGR